LSEFGQVFHCTDEIGAAVLYEFLNGKRKIGRLPAPSSNKADALHAAP
jgi:hypothetical protein